MGSQPDLELRAEHPELLLERPRHLDQHVLRREIDLAEPRAAVANSLVDVCDIASISFTSGAVIVAHGLWERAPDRRLRDQVILFNFATAATILIGIATLYAALFLLVFATAELLLSPTALTLGLRHSVETADYLTLAWFTASFATVGGALGAGLESDEAVREAAYASSHDVREEQSTDPNSDKSPPRS